MTTSDSTFTTIDKRFEQCAGLYAKQIALVDGPRRLSYKELNDQANHVAGHLQKMGVNPGDVVGLCHERSSEQIIGLLAIIKAGAVYLPLDTHYPDERLRLMLNTAAARLVICPADLTCRFEGRPCLADLNISDQPFTPVDREVDDAAYILFTSGSTGQPKGVVVPHRAVHRLVMNTSYARFDADRVFLQMAPLTFDASTFEIWGALLNGARLVLYPDRIPEPALLGELIGEYGVTTMWLTAALFNFIVDQSVDVLAPVAEVLTGGEALSVAHIYKAYRALPNVQLINGYGPTENTTFTCCYRIPRDFPETAASVPIGDAIAHTTVQVLDAELNIVPIGGEGELFTGGAGLALGYLKDNQLTAERFLIHPVSGERLYRTGDRVRRNQSGLIEFIGRMDDQLKIRGYRIEPGEIEAVLKSLPDVTDAVVLARPDAQGCLQLVAYLIAVASIDSIRSRLKEKLPSYMIPARLVNLPEFPLTANGKLDRHELPDPFVSVPAAEGDTDQTVIECLRRIWSSLLGGTHLDPDETFFNAGGHSLVAMQLVSSIQDEFGVKLTLADIFNHPSLSRQARLLADKQPESSTEQAPAPKSSEHYPLSSAQERVWFMQKLVPESRAYHFQIGIHFQGLLDVYSLESALQFMVERHEIYRTTFPDDSGQPCQRVHPSMDLQLTVIELADECALDEFIQKELSIPFDLERLPLIRWKLFRLSADKHVLLHMEHHILHDGWSFNLFLGELLSVYKSCITDQPIQLPSAPQYKEYSLQQQTWLESEACRTQLQYWQNTLSPSPPDLILPYDHPRRPLPSYKGRVYYTEIERDQWTRVLDGASTQGVTPFMLSLTALAITLGKISGQTDFCIGTGIACRRDVRSQGLAGMLVNNLPLRMQVADVLSGKELLVQVRDTALAAYEHQELPFDRIVSALRRGGVVNRNPIFQVMYSFHDSPLTDPGIDGLQVHIPPAYSNGTAKFDLNIIGMPGRVQHIGQKDSGEDLGISFMWEYNCDLFDASTLRNIEAAFQTVLFALVEHPAALISSLPLPATFRMPQVIRPEKPAASRSAATLENREVQQEVTKLWRRLLPQDAQASNFFEAGGHSLLALQLIHSLEQQFGCRVPLPGFMQDPTILYLTQVISSGVTGSGQKCLLEIQPGRDGFTPLFLVHTLGGDVGRYYRLAPRLPATRPVYGFQESDRDLDSIEALASCYLDELLAQQPEGPFVLGGYCFGGVVAFEMARQMEAKGLIVDQLVLLDSAPPNSDWKSTKRSPLQQLRLVGIKLQAFMHQDRAVKILRLRRIWNRLAGRSDQLEDYISIEETPGAYRVSAAKHFAALNRYTPENVSTPVNLLKIANPEHRLFAADYGWGLYCELPVNTILLTGSHESLFDEAHVDSLAAEVEHLVSLSDA